MEIGPKFAREIFSIFNLCLASNHESVKYLKDLNAKNKILEI